ncbi:MAG: hypothetical protein APF82_01630 [Sphingomonadales bacterium BRH_c42]|nr:MAG: hypothetical protein APF82_01630 [Sphingomonadales bacterium BRH_c42]
MELPKPKEADLDHAFAEAFEAERDFREWFLRGGRFARLANEAKLLVEEQKQARSDQVNRWWRWWWCTMPDGTQRETDLFFVFEALSKRFAIHIENKPSHGKLSIEQAADYRPRAVFMANDDRWLNYSDFETVLIAPTAFIRDNKGPVEQFDRVVTYESISRFVTLFGQDIDEEGWPAT